MRKGCSHCSVNFILLLFCLLEKPDKTVEEEKAALSSSSAQQQHPSFKPEEKPHADSAAPSEDLKKDSRRCVSV